jgi:hypothetical protein
MDFMYLSEEDQEENNQPELKAEKTNENKEKFAENSKVEPQKPDKKLY